MEIEKEDEFNLIIFNFVQIDQTIKGLMIQV